ncbi:MAG: translation initiation factor IF-2 [Caldisericales bacterium]|nr:translation initiation factor IF-2 [Caldisericales bacterium]
MGKIKVEELAVQLGVDPQEILESAKRLGESIKGVSSTLEDSTAAKIRASFLLRRPSPPPQEQKQPAQTRTSLFDVDKKKTPILKAATAEAVEAAKAAEAALVSSKEDKTAQKPEPITKVAKPEAKQAAVKKPIPPTILEEVKAKQPKPVKPEPKTEEKHELPKEEFKQVQPKQETIEPKSKKTPHREEAATPTKPAEEHKEAKEKEVQQEISSAPVKEKHPEHPKTKELPKAQEVRPVEEKIPVKEPPAKEKPQTEKPPEHTEKLIIDKTLNVPVSKFRSDQRPTGIQMPKRVEPVKLPPLPPQKQPLYPITPKSNFQRTPSSQRPPSQRPPSSGQKPPVTQRPVVDKDREKQKYEHAVDHNKDKQVSSVPFIVGKEHFVIKRTPPKSTRKTQQPKQAPKPVEVKPQKLTIDVFAKTAGIPEQRIMAYMLKQGYIPNPNEELAGPVLEMLSSAFGLKTSQEGTLSDENLIPRSPIVTVMGHVDHGKTTLLDYIRKTSVALGEAGGITQSIGAYKVTVNGRDIVFIDTPGHEAFATMRREGANVTDIVVLVVAADEGVKEQTIEALNMAKEAKVTVIVAANKMDRPGANLDKLYSQLAELGLTPEAWGGETMVAPITAKTGDGVKDLLEMILLQADILDLKMNKAGKLAGTIIESHMDRFVGPLATAIIQSGQLKAGDYIEAGNAWGRVKALFDHADKKIQKIQAISPVKIMGFDQVPKPGSILLSSDISRRRKPDKGQVLEPQAIPQVPAGDEAPSNLDDLFKVFDQQGATKLNVVVKADSEGSLDAVKFALSKIKIKDIPANIVYSGIGVISDNDVLLADASKAMLVGFNVQIDPIAKKTSKQNGIPINTYNIIFELTDAITEAIKRLIAPEYRDVKVGQAEVRQVFNISDVGNIAGCFVSEGYVNHKVKVRVVRNRLPVYEGKISSLKRFKEDTHEVKAGYECGIGIQDFNDIKVGDTLEFYTTQEVQ